MTRSIIFIADDYGISAGVDEAILSLLDAGRLSGTSCMTAFPEWAQEAGRLRAHSGSAAIGLHLTLTDQPALTGRSPLAPSGRLPPLRQLVLSQLTGRLDAGAVHAELDAQHERFVDAMEQGPDFIDGHQHVHFLRVVRDWLTARHAGAAASPKPALRGAPRNAMFSRKTAAVSFLSSGFDEEMAVCGFRLMAPLAGFYDWRQPSLFATTLQRALARLPDGAVFMCHPGKADAALRERDGLVEARETELALLSSTSFTDMLRAADVRVARVRR